MFKSALVLFALAASASAASLGGISIDSGSFGIANVNPTLGTSTVAQKTFTVRPSGGLSFTNVRFDKNDMVWSLQADSSNQGYLVKQDLRVNGRREECWLSASVRPIQIFNDAGSSVTAVAVTSTGVFGVYRFSINPNNRICTSAQLETLSSVSSVSSTVSAQSGSNIFFATEANTGFSSTSGAQIRGYTISTNSAKVINTPIDLPGIFVTGLVADSDTTLIAVGFDVSSANTFGAWSVDIAKGTYSSTPRTISSTQELSLGAAYVNSNLYVSKLTRDSTTLSNSKTYIGSIDYSTTSTVETVRTTAFTNGITTLTGIADATFAAIDTDTTSTSNTVLMTGANLYASTSSSSSLSKCRFTVGTLAAAEATAVASSTREGVSCTFTAPTASTTAGTVIKAEFAADGINYSANTVSFLYGGSSSSVASVKFVSNNYRLDDGVAFPSNRAPIAAELFDASGNKLLFSTTAVTATLSASSSDASVVTTSGASASSFNGRVEFPNFFVDAFSTSAASGIATIQLQASANSVSAIAAASLRVINKSRGSAAALSLGSSKFSYSVINPTAGTSVSLGDRTLTSGNSIAYGLSTFDADNNVLNTVELDSSAVPYLIGQAIRTGVASQGGVGSCIIPTTTNVKDTPVKITYEKTNSDGSVDFLGLVVLSGVTGTNYQIVRYNRLASSAATATCTKSVVEQLPQSELAYTHAAFLNDNRIALVERDNIFSTSQTAFIHVWKMTDGTKGGSWVIRNKALSFSVIGITQAGDSDLAISGSVTSGGVVTSGVWRLDLTDDASAVLAPTTSKDKFTTDNEQAYFLYAGNADAPSDARLRTSVSQTSAGVRNTDVIQVFNGNAVAADARATTATADHIALFNINDASVTSVSPTTLASTATANVKVTASNVISSTSLKCRFSATGLASFETTVASTTATATFPADGTAYDCGSFPTTLLGDRAVYVQLSNDGGANYGPAACIAVGSGSCPAILGVTATATATAAPANPVTLTGLDVTKSKALISRNLAFTPANCAAVLAIGQAKAAEKGYTLSGNTECVEIAETTVATGRVKALASGVQINIEFATAADKALFDAFLVSDEGKQWLADNNLEASDITTSVAGTTDDDDDLSDGEIAGIVIGSVAGVALIGALIAFALKGSKGSAAPAAAAPAATYASRDVTAGSSTGSYDYTSGSYDSEDYSGSYDSEDYSGSYDGSTGSYSDYV